MDLGDLLFFDTITIQCHNVPDADAIGSGFALYEYFSRSGKQCRFVFGGELPIDKPSLQKLITHVNIPLEYLPKPDGSVPELLLLVDCQYGAGNVMPMPFRQVAVIDHHVPEGSQPELSVIRPDCGACASLVRDLLIREDAELSQKANTALHYGLYMDTQYFAELRNALDRNLLEETNIDESLINELKKSNLRLEDLNIASEALRSLQYFAEHKCVILQAPPCDPNILGFLADLALNAEGVDLCLAWQRDDAFCRYSVRSVEREVKASDLAAWLGYGGGHLQKAGGRLPLSVLRERAPGLSPQEYFPARLHEYFAEYGEVIDCANCADFAGLPSKDFALYRKLPLTLGYIPCKELFPDADTIYVRMLESDASFPANADTYLLIGALGEVYPIDVATFEKSYSPLPEPYTLNTEYSPIAAGVNKIGKADRAEVLNLRSGNNISLLRHARACRSSESLILAKQLSKGIKIFSRWDAKQYMLGNAGDWLAVRKGHPKDIYIIRNDIFAQTYVAA